MDGKRDYMLGVKLTEDERRTLRTLARAEERTPSDLVRRLIRAAARDLPADVKEAAHAPRRQT